MNKIIETLDRIAAEIKGAAAGAAAGLIFTPDYSHLLNVAMESLIKGVFGALGGLIFAISIKHFAIPVGKRIWRAIYERN